jgi:integrase
MSTSDKVYQQLCEDLPYINATSKKLADGSTKIYRRVQIARGKGAKRIAIEADWGSKAFVDQYHLAIDELTSDTLQVVKDTPISKREIPAGDPRATLGWLYENYLASEEFSRLASSTQYMKKMRLRKIMEANRFVEWKNLKRSHIKEKLAKIKQDAGGKRGGDEARNSMKKDLSAIFKWAVNEGYAHDDFINPCSGIKKLMPAKGTQIGQRAWTQAEVDQFLDHHQLGTVQHLYMQMLISFGPRISDAWRLGKQNLVKPTGERGWSIRFVTQKTGRTIEVPLTETLAQAIAACPSEHMQLLWTHWHQRTEKRPFKSVKTLANWFDLACATAGLPKGLTSHGVRKTCATKLAEHSTEYQLMAVFGWKRADEARPYIEAANKLKQAAVAMKQDVVQLSDRAVSNYLDKVC